MILFSFSFTTIGRLIGRGEAQTLSCAEFGFNGQRRNRLCTDKQTNRKTVQNHTNSIQRCVVFWLSHFALQCSATLFPFDFCSLSTNHSFVCLSLSLFVWLFAWLLGSISYCHLSPCVSPFLPLTLYFPFLFFSLSLSFTPFHCYHHFISFHCNNSTTLPSSL